jgi:hypothetical protein
MNRHDRKLWASARTLQDLSDLTARWLEGKIRYNPGYGGGPNSETTELIPVLAACNRAGFLTSSSQPGIADDGTGSAQRAAATGYADLATTNRLCAIAQAAGMKASAWRAAPKRTIYDFAEVVTIDQGRPFTSFGARLSRRDVRFEFDGCHRDAVRAVCDAWQITLIDTEWGREPSPLWAALADFAGLAVAS